MIELKPLQGLVKTLVEDLRGQVAADEELRARLEKEYAEAKAAERIGATFETWLDDVLDLAGVAWVLGCVFVRFCEDNGLIDKVWIGGPDGAAPVERATQARQAYGVAKPLHNDRHWLQEAFGYMRGLRATEKIFDGHNPVWTFDISGDAAEALFDFFRRGEGFRSLRTEDLDTRFLGDLYQDLSAHARATYALLQTPEFVEEFILDRTFEPAVAEFGLPETSVIDPTCGSGHFLLGAFERLLAKWLEREPATPIDALVERALGQVTGVDINPFAVAIARFRLVVAALQATGRRNLNNSYPVRVATGDSLLHWGETSRHQGDLLADMEGRPAFAYYTEDGELLADYLRSRQYTVVVGNPPYITVKDKVLNERYRQTYSACLGRYAMTVPFAERFFELARRGDTHGDGAGYVGQITSNSFMKREFGKKLVDGVFSRRVELSAIVDTSGAYIPGHGTPTVILVGRNRLVSPRYSGHVRVVMGIQGEPAKPDDPVNGMVWRAIVDQIDNVNSESQWVGVADMPREPAFAHPWSLSGGGAATAFDSIVAGGPRLMKEVIDGSFGFAGFSATDDAFDFSAAWHRRRCTPMSLVRGLVAARDIGDWSSSTDVLSIAPYDERGHVIQLDTRLPWARHFWTTREQLKSLSTFSGERRTDKGIAWWSWYQWSVTKTSAVRTLAIAKIATHNRAFVNADHYVTNQHVHAAVPSSTISASDLYGITGVLNSSTACFWLKQVSHNKGRPGAEQAGADEPWEHRYEFTGAKLQEFPLPAVYPLELSQELDGLAQRTRA